MSLLRRILVERRAVVLPLAVLILANVGTYMLVVLPLQHSVTSAGIESVRALGELAQARRDLADAKNARASTLRADEELKRFYEGVLATTFPQARDIADFWLDRTARQAGVTKRESQYDYELVKNSHLVRVSGKVDLEGSYSNIRRFLYGAETAHEFIVIDKVALAENSATAPGAAGALALTLELSTYYVAVSAK